MERRDAIKKTALALGLALTSASVRSALGQEAVKVGSGAKFLTPAQFDFVAAMTERIFPKSDTPGAVDVGVPEFVDLTYGKYLNPDEATALMAGLSEVESECHSKFGKGFADLAIEEQIEILELLAATKNPFYKEMRELTVVGYFTSEKVGKEVLNYLPIPGGFDPCISIEDVGNVNWSD